MGYRTSPVTDDIASVMDSYLICIAADYIARGRSPAWILRACPRMTPALVAFAGKEMNGPVSKSTRRTLRRQHVIEERYYRLSLDLQRAGVAHVVQASALRLSVSMLKRWHGAEPAPATTVDGVALAKNLGVQTMSGVPGHVMFTMHDLYLDAHFRPHDEGGVRRYCGGFTMVDGTSIEFEVRDGEGLRVALMILARHWATGGDLPSACDADCR